MSVIGPDLEPASEPKMVCPDCRRSGHTSGCVVLSAIVVDATKARHGRLALAQAPCSNLTRTKDVTAINITTSSRCTEPLRFALCVQGLSVNVSGISRWPSDIECLLWVSCPCHWSGRRLAAVPRSAACTQVWRTNLVSDLEAGRPERVWQT